MSKKLLINVSHNVLAHMYQDILKDAGIEVYLSEQDLPHLMHLYLGNPPKGVDVYVDTENLEEAKRILNEAEIKDD